MQTQSPHSPVTGKFGLARLLQQGCSTSSNLYCRQGSPDTEGKQSEKKKKPALFLILATTRKAWPAVSRLARRDGTVGARRGHLSSSKREMRGPARAGPAAPATPTRGCASGSGCCSQGWLRGLSSLLFLPRGFLQSPRHKELRLLHHTGP